MCARAQQKASPAVLLPVLVSYSRTGRILPVKPELVGGCYGNATMGGQWGQIDQIDGPEIEFS